MNRDEVRPTDCPDCWGTGVDVYRELCGTCGGRTTSAVPGKRERHLLQGDWGFLTKDWELRDAGRLDRSDTALALRLRRMVQP